MAFETLSDAQKRAEYDRKLSFGFGDGAFGSSWGRGATSSGGGGASYGSSRAGGYGGAAGGYGAGRSRKSQEEEDFYGLVRGCEAGALWFLFNVVSGAQLGGWLACQPRGRPFDLE